MTLTMIVVLAAATPKGSDGFDAATGLVPAAWACGVTGAGQAKWSVEKDSAAPSGPNVLSQRGEADFPWCRLKDALLANGYVEVKLKPISGAEDQAGGVIWRFKDGDHYYIARANAVEDNVAFFVMHKGKRRMLKSVALHVATGAWHSLRVEFDGPRFALLFDGKRVLDLDDRTLAEAGSVGVWTKGDSVTAFDDFAFGPR
jgi:hypothetical protein